VRAKTLFASTRSTLTRELGTEKFGSTVFATEEEEILGVEAWKERDGEGAGGVSREDMMGEKERELESVRRAEAEARNGTPGRDIGIGGTFGPGSGSGMKISMPVDEGAKTALGDLQDGGLVQLVRSCYGDYGGIECGGICEINMLTSSRRLISSRRRSRWPIPSLVLSQTPSPHISPRLRRAIPSTTTPGLMSWSLCTLVRPDRLSRSACCTPARGGTPLRLLNRKDSRS
jgi:hypothetical protein